MLTLQTLAPASQDIMNASSAHEAAAAWWTETLTTAIKDGTDAFEAFGSPSDEDFALFQGQLAGEIEDALKVRSCVEVTAGYKGLDEILAHSTYGTLISTDNAIWPQRFVRATHHEVVVASRLPQSVMWGVEHIIWPTSKAVKTVEVHTLGSKSDKSKASAM